MKTKKTVILMVRAAIILMVGFHSGISVKAQCTYGPQMVICFYSPGEKNIWSLGCCGGFGECGNITDGQMTGQMYGWYIVNPVIAIVPTCADGDSATNAAPFTGSCYWTVSGSTCGTPWGPIPGAGGTYNAYNCIGYCPHNY